MNHSKSKLVIAAIAFSSAAALAADQPVRYGRAGGTVGADRIQQLTDWKGRPIAETPDLSMSYGRAGGMVGADRIQQLAAVKASPVKAYAVGSTKGRTVYGRAGVPLPFAN